MDELIEYNGYYIYHNYYDEWCVCYDNNTMVTPDSAFKSKQEAMQYITDLLSIHER